MVNMLISLSKTKSGHSGGAVCPGPAPAEYDRQSLRRGLRANPYSVRTASGFDCSSLRKFEVDTEDAAHQILRHGRGIPVGSNQSAFTITILPWRSRSGGPNPDAHRPNTPSKDAAVDAVPIANEIAWSLLRTISLRQLPSYPFGAWIRGCPKPRISRRLC